MFFISDTGLVEVQFSVIDTGSLLPRRCMAFIQGGKVYKADIEWKGNSQSKGGLMLTFDMKD